MNAGTERTVEQDELEAMIARGEIACQWFARCPNAATHLEPHPVLTMVPTCDPCGEFIKANA